MRNFVYLVSCHTQKTVGIVDPQSDLRPLEDLKSQGYRLERLLLTHSHFDHVAGVLPLLEKLPDLRLNLHEGDYFRLDKKLSAFRDRIDFLVDGHSFKIGLLNLRAIHTPGHSRGALSYFLDHAPPLLLTGDTLFIRDCGRTDLETGSNEEMYASLQKYKLLPPDTVILPGHHYAAECASTLARELRESPPLLARSVEELTTLP